MEVFILAQVSLRGVSEHPLLVIGPTKMTEPARAAALFACRAATGEALLGQPGFWCSAVRIYHTGHWPFGRTTSGSALVL
jgi:hypothetical protein